MRSLTLILWICSPKRIQRPKKNVKLVLRYQTHQAEERAKPVDRQKHEIDAHHSTPPLDEFEWDRKVPGYHDYECNNSNGSDGPVNVVVVVEWADSKNETELDATKDTEQRYTYGQSR